MLACVALLLAQPLASGFYHSELALPLGSKNPDSISVRIHRLGSQRIIWSRTFAMHPAVFWSKDKRAVAILDSDFALTVWRDGERVRRRKVGPFPDNFGEPPAYAERHRWSPDKQRVLLLVPPTQGSGDFGIGQGWIRIVNVDTWKVEDIDGATKAEWIDNRTIQYWGDVVWENGEMDFRDWGPVKKRVR